MAIDVTGATFRADVIDKSSTVPVVVDLWAPWCGPCRTIGPILEKAVDATEGKVVLTKVNVDENPQISAQFQVQSIPAVYALRDGRIVDGFLGAVPSATSSASSVAAAVRGADDLDVAHRGRRRAPACARPSSSTPATRMPSSPWRRCSSGSSSSRRRSPCSNGSLSRNAPDRSPPPPGWVSRRPARRRATSTTPSSRRCSHGSRTTTMPGSSSSTSSRCWGTDDPRTAEYRKSSAANCSRASSR